MKRFMLVGLATASLAMADEPVRTTRQAPSPETPAGAARLPAGLRAPAGVSRQMHAWLHAGGLQGAWLHGDGRLYQVAWFHICADPAHDPARIPGFRSARPGRGFPSTSDYYPPQSLQLRESGDVLVRACVGKDGYLTAPPMIYRTSGSPSLDAAALRVASDGSGKYLPGTANGLPVEAWVVFKVTFIFETWSSTHAMPYAPGSDNPRSDASQSGPQRSDQRSDPPRSVPQRSDRNTP